MSEDPMQPLPVDEPLCWHHFESVVAVLRTSPSGAIPFDALLPTWKHSCTLWKQAPYIASSFRHVDSTFSWTMPPYGSLSVSSWICNGLSTAMSRTSISTLLIAEPAHVPSPSKPEKDYLSPYIERYGRLYHRRLADLYPYPCDEAELERLDALHHAIYNVALQGNLHTSILSKPPLRVLDIGCGTGIWAISMAEKYPDAETTAIDLGSYYPRQDGVDFGVKFIPGIDFTHGGWLSEVNGSFDFIHMGLLCGSVPDWRGLFRQAHRLLKPGGRLESIEFDWRPYSSAMVNHNVSDLAIVQRWWQSIHTATSQSGRPLAYPASMEDHVRAAGFTATTHEAINISNAEDMRLHPDDASNQLARWHRYTTFHPHFSTIRAISMEPLTRYTGHSEEQAATLCETVNRLLNRPDSPYFHKLHIISATRD